MSQLHEQSEEEQYVLLHLHPIKRSRTLLLLRVGGRVLHGQRIHPLLPHLYHHHHHQPHPQPNLSPRLSRGIVYFTQLIEATLIQGILLMTAISFVLEIIVNFVVVKRMDGKRISKLKVIA